MRNIRLRACLASRLRGNDVFAALAASAEPAPNKDLRGAVRSRVQAGHPGASGARHPLRHPGLRRQAHGPLARGDRAAQGTREGRDRGARSASTRATLGTQDRISRDIALESAELEDSENAFYRGLPFGADFADSWNAVSTMRGPELGMAYVVNATRFATVADYENYLKRLSKRSRLARPGHRRSCAPGIRSGWMPPHEAMVTVPKMFDDFARRRHHALADVDPVHEIPRAKSPRPIAIASPPRPPRPLGRGASRVRRSSSSSSRRNTCPPRARSSRPRRCPAGRRTTRCACARTRHYHLDPAEIHEMGLPKSRASAARWTR